MNKSYAIVVTAFLCGALFMLGMLELVDRSTALAKDQIVPPEPKAGPAPPKTTIAPIGGPGEKIYVGDVPKDVLLLQVQVRELQGQVSTLQQGLQAQQAALEKLQAQYANHHHVVQEPAIPHPFRGAMYTTLNCPGIGQPCSLNSSQPGGSTYGLYLFPPGSGPPNTEPPGANVNSSGPQD